MKLYYFPPSSYSQKVLITCSEKQVESEKVIVDLFDPDEVDKYREIYPIGKVPFLIVKEGHMISEASIIAEFLDTYSESGPQLLPKDPNESRRVRYHDRMIDLYLNDSVGSLFFELRKPETDQNKDKIENWRRLANVVLQFTESDMGNREWLHDDIFTLSDIAAAVALKTASLTMQFDNYPNVQNYYQRLSERPSIAKVFADAQPYYDKLASQIN